MQTEARLCYDLDNKTLFIDECNSMADADIFTIYTKPDGSRFICVTRINKYIVTKGKRNPNWIDCDEFFKERIDKFARNESFDTIDKLILALERTSNIRDKQYFDATGYHTAHDIAKLEKLRERYEKGEIVDAVTIEKD